MVVVFSLLSKEIAINGKAVGLSVGLPV